MGERALSCRGILKATFESVSKGFNWLVKPFWVVVLVLWGSQLILPSLGNPTLWQIFVSLLLSCLGTLGLLKIAKSLVEGTRESLGGIISFALGKYIWMLIVVGILWVFVYIVTRGVFFLAQLLTAILVSFLRLGVSFAAISYGILAMVGIYLEVYMLFRFGLLLWIFLLEGKGLIEAFIESWKVTGKHFRSYLCLFFLLAIGLVVGFVISTPSASLGMGVMKLVFSFTMTCIGILFTTALYLFYKRAVAEEVPQVMGEDANG